MTQFVIIKSWCPHNRFVAFVRKAAAALQGNGGTLVTAAPVHHVQVVEPGSLAAHIWIAQFPSVDNAMQFWAAVDGTQSLAHDRPPVALTMAGVPASGLGDAIPTAANVPDRGDYTAPGILLIEGSANDQDRMDQYRDILLPLMRDFGAAYDVFELGGSVTVLSGAWSEAIIAISRWPSRDAATAMWLSARYQNDAIPLRLGVGQFSVLLTDGERCV